MQNCYQSILMRLTMMYDHITFIMHTLIKWKVKIKIGVRARSLAQSIL